MPDAELTPEEEAENSELLRFVGDWLHFRDIKRRQIAEILDVSEATISKWLSGKQAMNVGQFRALARALNCTPGELLCAPQDRETAATNQALAEIANSLKGEALDSWLAQGRLLKKMSER